jgi:hypothetical protein
MRPAAAVLAAVLAACSSGGGGGDLASYGGRAEVARVSFNKWTDFITLQVGLDDRCEALFPAVVDDSTAWPPLQVTWVIYDDPRHVVNGDEIVDTFYAGDRLSIADFEPIDGIDPKGFKFLPPGQRAFLSVQHIEVHEDGDLVIDALFGRPMRARLFLETEGQDGDCVTRTSWCPAEGACTPQPLSEVYVELGSLNTVREVTFLP